MWHSRTHCRPHLSALADNKLEGTSPFWILELSPCATSKCKSMLNVRRQTTVEQQRDEVKGKEEYAHGLGMSNDFQGLRACFLTLPTLCGPQLKSTSPHYIKHQNSLHGMNLLMNVLCGGQRCMWVFLISSCQKNTTFPPPHAGVRENVLHSHASFYTSHTSRFQGCANTGQNISCRHVGVQETQMFAFFFPSQSQSSIVLHAGRETFCFYWQRGHWCAWDVRWVMCVMWVRTPKIVGHAFYLLAFMKVRLFQMALHEMCFNSWSQRWIKR